MHLEISIEALLYKEKIESNRIEFKKGWNPDDIYRSICAFANDFDNQGGGYILVGVEEENGVAVRPVIGIDENTIDEIEKAMVGYDRKIIPAYSAKISIEEVDGKKIIALWCPTGVERPYKVPDNVTSTKEKNHKVRIRSKSSSVVATAEQEKELYSMASREPFDMVGNPKASFEDISEILLTEHLKTTGSRLAGQVRTRGVEEVLEEMQLLSGPREMHRIRNVALMMFCEHPDKFFPYLQVDIVKFPKGSIKSPNSFIEVPPIKGTVPQVINRALEKISDMAIENRIDKISGQIESVTTTSYPENAIKEALVNAFYHRDYKIFEPVTVEIEPECIRIINCPGIDRSIPDSAIKEGKRFRTRYYRNRRLGEFLHELELCEGHCTGVPTIQEELELNGSPMATFETDEDRQSVCVTIPIHPRFLENSNEADEKSSLGGTTTRLPQDYHKTTTSNKEIIKRMMRDNDVITVAQIAKQTGLTINGVRYHIKQMKKLGEIERVGGNYGGKWKVND